jgi:hypothetical protein
LSDSPGSVAAQLVRGDISDVKACRFDRPIATTALGQPTQIAGCDYISSAPRQGSAQIGAQSDVDAKLTASLTKPQQQMQQQQ